MEAFEAVGLFSGYNNASQSKILTKKERNKRNVRNKVASASRRRNRR
jgi:hypothetical protein